MSARTVDFRALDDQLARAFASIWPGSDDAALDLVKLASWAVGQGHTCFDPNLDEPALAQDPTVIALRNGDWPQAPFAGAPDRGLPLVVQGGRVWLRRYWQYEREIEAALRGRASLCEPLPDAKEVARRLDQLMPNAQDGDIDWQRVAAAMSVRSSLSVICGGPGTGKTWTALRVLALLRQLANRPLRIAMAAPTGKAAQRLGESVQAGLANLPLSDDERADLSVAATTLHRLLGFRPQAVQPHRNAEHRLDLDVLLVDECSMVDLPLMAKLLRALPDHCRLILLGDPDQLPAVENGAVLASLAACNEGNQFAPEAAEWIAACTGAKVEKVKKAAPIAACIVRLQRPRRFGGESGIARLVRAIRSGDLDSVIEALRGSEDVQWIESPWQGSSANTREHLRGQFGDLENIDKPADAIERLGHYRILCALREGPRGVQGLNQAVLKALDGATDTRWLQAGRPVLITGNDHALRLFNGDVGIALGNPMRIWFASDDGNPRAFLPGQLPSHECAYAMTVHKAQGSEFDCVELVLPSEPIPLLTREWLYTAASRARDKLIIHATRTVIEKALSTRSQRINGLDFS